MGPEEVAGDGRWVWCICGFVYIYLSLYIYMHADAVWNVLKVMSNRIPPQSR